MLAVTYSCGHTVLCADGQGDRAAASSDVCPSCQLSECTYTVTDSADQPVLAKESPGSRGINGHDH